MGVFREVLGRTDFGVLDDSVAICRGVMYGIMPEVRIVDLDPEVFAAARKYFQPYNHLDTLGNWTFMADDASPAVA